MSALREDSGRDVYDLNNKQLAHMPMTTFVSEHVLLVARAFPNIGYLFAVRARARTSGLPWNPFPGLISRRYEKYTWLLFDSQPLEEVCFTTYVCFHCSPTESLPRLMV